MKQLTAKKYRELFKLRAEGKLDDMECTKSLYKILKPLYFNGMKILDIPCGVGHYFRKIRELGNIDYLGIDFDSKAIDMAEEIWKDAPNARFEVQNVFNLSLKGDSMDIVFCHNLLLHLSDYKDALRELLRVSKKYLIIRSLFDEKKSINSVDVAKDYLDVYPSGKIWYNTYARNDVAQFLKNLGPCKFKFIKDNPLVSQEGIVKQKKLLRVDSSEFAKGGGKKRQEFKGMKLNYEVLFIEKIKN